MFGLLVENWEYSQTESWWSSELERMVKQRGFYCPRQQKKIYKEMYRFKLSVSSSLLSVNLSITEAYNSWSHMTIGRTD